MKQFRQFLLTLALVAVLVVPPVASAQAVGQPHDPTTDAAQGPAYARVVKRYGAAIRAEPSSESMIYWMASCNDLFLVIGRAGDWYEVLDTDGTSGWVGGARVAVGAAPPRVDCRGAVTFQAGGVVYVTTPSGCLSIRHQPSRTATFDACVPGGSLLEIMNGPIEVAGEDWFEVWSPSTGRGWALAAYMRPAR